MIKLYNAMYHIVNEKNAFARLKIAYENIYALKYTSTSVEYICHLSWAQNKMKKKIVGQKLLLVICQKVKYVS